MFFAAGLPGGTRLSRARPGGMALPGIPGRHPARGAAGSSADPASSGPGLLRCWPPSGEIGLPALSGSGRPCPAAVRSLVPDAPLRAARRPFPPFRQRAPAILTGTLPCLSLAAGSRREDGAGRLKSAVLWAMRSDCRGWRVTAMPGDTCPVPCHHSKNCRAALVACRLRVIPGRGGKKRLFVKGAPRGIYC